MKNLKDILNDFIKRFADENEFYSVRARVVSVDEIKFTCNVVTLENYDSTVELSEQVDLINVQLGANTNLKFGVVLLPAIESTVIVGFNSKTDAHIVKFGLLSEIKVIFDDRENPATQIIIKPNEILINSDLLTFNDGENNGLVKVQEMSDRLNELESLFTQLQTDFSSWVTVPQDGGAALKAILSAGFGIQVIPNSKIDDFQNDKILQ